MDLELGQASALLGKEATASQQWPQQIHIEAEDSSVSCFLDGWSLGQYLNTKPPSTVVCLDVGMSIGTAMRQLATHGISSAPLLEGSSYRGFIDMRDFVTYLLSTINIRDMTADNIEYQLRSAGASMAQNQVHTVHTDLYLAHPRYLYEHPRYLPI